MAYPERLLGGRLKGSGGPERVPKSGPLVRLVCGPKRSPDHERQKTHDGLPRNGSLHLQEQILNFTLPGQFHAGERDASP